MVYPHIAYCGPAYPDHPQAGNRHAGNGHAGDRQAGDHQAGDRRAGDPAEAIARELDSRTNDGIHVRLLWHPADGHVSVAVHDTKTGDEFEVPVGAGERARDVYHHPFAYAVSPAQGA